jgi:hypothetical protein
MQIIFRYVVVPLLCLLTGLLCCVWLARHYPQPFLIVTSTLLFLALVNGWRRNRRLRRRGWRVGHQGRDSLYYDELRDGRWRRIEIGGEMELQTHVIYLRSLQLPDWAADRRVEIISRIKEDLRPPAYEYSE